MTTLLLTTNTDAALNNAGGSIGGLTLLVLFISFVWIIFPFVVWMKLNRLIDYTHRALNNLRIIAESVEKPDQPKS
jgi:hypothetical protein